ncbi:hypothetical protein ACQBAT_03200 [Ornithinimicrobium sp. Y1847]|uniref:hypothetical protein n=1 Tax=unclassified Ornithinimicrobium TaxID=2615080 RepID=UPI003B67ADE2
MDLLLYVVLPLVLAVLGAVLLLRGRAMYREATRLRAGFGGPPGSIDVGTELGFGVEDNRAAILAAQRRMLWGGILGGIGAIWAVVGLIMLLR